MIKRHKIIAYLKEDEWKKLWQMKSELLGIPFSKIIEKLIDEYFENHGLIFDEEIKKSKGN